MSFIVLKDVPVIVIQDVPCLLTVIFSHETLTVTIVDDL